LGQDDADSGKEDPDEDPEIHSDDGYDGAECLDCGGRVIGHDETSRKWEIKVYAANGLMKSGAWAAAWREMEKVDVEVGLWLPSDVRVELERKILDEELLAMEEELKASEAVRDVAETPKSTFQDQIDGLDDILRVERRDFSAANMETPRREPEPAMSATYRKTAQEIDLQTVLINYIRLLAHDRRNVAIAFLSVLVLFFAVSGGQQKPPSYLPDIIQFRDIPAVVTAVYHSGSTSSTLVQSATQPPLVQVSEISIEKPAETPTVTPVVGAEEKQS
jgi:hypothetical protein